MEDVRDRQESAEDIEKALILLQLTRHRFDALVEPTLPLPGSVLHVEGRDHSPIDPTDTIFAMHRGRAVDNMGRVFEMILDADEERAIAHPYAPYSLIRTGIESSALALWTVMPEKKADRARRSMQLTYRAVEERADLLKAVAPARYLKSEQKRVESFNRKLSEALQRTPGLNGLVPKGPPSYTEILKSVSTPVREDGRARYELNSPLAAWKICSSFIHGSDHIIRALSDYRQLTEFNGDGLATAELSPSFQLIAGSIHTAVKLIERADARHAHLATHDHSGRALEQAAS